MTITSFQKDFEEIDELLNVFSVPNVKKETLITEELKKITVRSILSAFAIPSQAYLDRLDSFHENWQADYDQQTKSMYHNHPNYKNLRDKINRGGDRDYLSGRLESASQLHVDHITSTKALHEEHHIFKLLLSTEERSEIANSNENLAPLGSAANQSKGDRPLDEWAKDTRKGQSENNIKRFGLSEENVESTAQKNKNFIKSKQREVIMNEMGSLGKTIAKSTLRLIIGYCLYKTAVVVLDEATKIIAEGYNTITSFCKKIVGKASEIFQKIRESVATHIKKILADSLNQSALSAVISFIIGIISAIFNRVFNIRLIVMILQQALGLLVRSVKTLWSQQKNKKEVLIKIVLSSLNAVALICVSDIILGFLPDFPFKMEIGNVLAGIIIGTLGLLLITQYEGIKNRFNDFFRRDAAFAMRLEEEYKRVSELYTKVYQKIIKDVYEYYNELEKIIGDTFNPNASFTEQFDSSIALAEFAGVADEKIIHSIEEGKRFFES